MSTLKKLRISKKLTQKEASALVGVSLRSYKDYENEESKVGTIKYNYMLQLLENYIELDEEHGLLTIEDIILGCKSILEQYEVKYCILFGSYSKGTANELSDVDLLISTEITGISFLGIAERLRKLLRKKIDLLEIRQLSNNQQLLDDILSDGIKIYEKI